MKRSRQERTRFWQQHVDAAKLFAGSAQKYCDEQEIESSSFYHWRKILSGSTQSSSRSDFLPVIVSKPERAEQSSEANLPNAQWVAEVMLHLIRGLA
jgi:hypothetical protein